MSISILFISDLIFEPWMIVWSNGFSASSFRCSSETSLFTCICVCLQTSLLDLKEHASSLASSGLKKDSKLKSLEIALEQKKEECLKLENQLKRVRSSDNIFKE